MRILNVTQHRATAEQVAAGVVDIETTDGEYFATKIKSLLTFDEIPSREEMELRAEDIACFCHDGGHKAVMIGGAPFFMAYLEKALKAWDIQPLYAFSKRESIEKEIDGKIVKTNIFKHIGFVEA